MQLNQARILLTGASGGLGQALAQQLSAGGAALLLTGREGDRMGGLVPDPGGELSCLQADLTDAGDLDRIAAAARDFGVNVLINGAGIGCFGLLEEQAWPSIERVLQINLAMPMQLTHTLLPWLTAQPQAVIVNIGSTFGSLPFPGFAAYSAAKAGLRGFAHALRRELADTSVAVVHLAPRAIDTPLNSPAVNALNRQLGNRSDSPADVARQVVEALLREDRERHFGFPERLFAWLNGVAPRIIDRALVGQLAIVKKHASTP
jgi:short-subunit dehydrogenase